SLQWETAGGRRLTRASPGRPGRGPATAPRRHVPAMPPRLDPGATPPPPRDTDLPRPRHRAASPRPQHSPALHRSSVPRRYGREQAAGGRQGQARATGDWRGAAPLPLPVGLWIGSVTRSMCQSEAARLELPLTRPSPLRRQRAVLRVAYLDVSLAMATGWWSSKAEKAFQFFMKSSRL
ncbi:hypothetical protein U9M48_030850, partial [Paspalum notatum var. saurae]